MKIRAQVMLDSNLYYTLTGLQKQHNVKSLSVLINKLLKEAFNLKNIIEQKEKTIEQLQISLTNEGTRAHGYKKQIEEMLKNENKTNKSKKK